MRKTKVLIPCLLAFVLIGPLIGVWLVPLVPKTGSLLEAVPLQPQYIVEDSSTLTYLSNRIHTLDDIYFEPTANITGVTLENFTLANGLRFQVQQLDPYVLNFAMEDVNLTGNADIKGSPTISATHVNISQTFESYNYGGDETIGSPHLALVDVNASLMRFRVSGGTLNWESSKTNALTLIGFENAVLQSSIIVGALMVGGTGNVTLIDTTYGSIVETVVPTIIPERTTYNLPYSFVFEPTLTLNVKWIAYDNIQGAGFDLQTNLTIYKNGMYERTIPNVLTTSQSVVLDTAAAYYEIRISCKDTQGNLATETITIVMSPNLLWFILMIVLIAGAAVGIVVLLYWRRAHQWQKTALLDIPS